MTYLALLKAIDFRWYIIAVLVAAIGLLSLDGNRVRGQRDKAISTHAKLLIDLRVAEEAAKALEGTATASAELAKGVATQRRSIASTASKKELDHAIKTDPSGPPWADTPVPDGVRSALKAARARAAQPAASGPAG